MPVRGLARLEVAMSVPDLSVFGSSTLAHGSA